MKGGDRTNLDSQFANEISVGVCDVVSSPCMVQFISIMI